MDPKLPIFGTYEEAKIRIELSIKFPQAISKAKRKMEKIKTDTGPLMITEGQGEDEEEKESEEETVKVAEPPRKKGKVFITKPQKQPTAVFTRKTRKGKKESEPVFVRSAPTFEERMKQLKEGAGICNFKALKYETRTPEEQKRIEDLVIEKMGVWKYSPAQIKPQIHSDLYEKIIVRWDLTTQTVKDIFRQ